MKKEQLNDGYYHEMLDRTSVICNTIEDQLLTHPVAKRHKKIRKALKRAQVELKTAYTE